MRYSQEVEESANKTEENGTNVVEQETNGRDQNGELGKGVGEDVNHETAEGKVAEEKTKKRLSDSSFNIVKPKRTKSSEGLCCYFSELRLVSNEHS